MSFTTAGAETPLSILATTIAHQGGWDEILFVGAPLVVFAGLLYLANKRANEQSERGSDD